ncbi:KilA-N domain-containing protein [Thiolapillus brandeum]|uniref:KilA-N domain-containing protein n=1 Tax=Thiolapillus brandeum TaxID=1076588 RepID=A0A7U6GHU1_9GAMM|nr:KilA-N domain-containing protein [Thiolapillus brandeum]BAO43890.1 hypothetical protein TBH_C0960 [Thiolapillus brandeum]
MQQQELIPVEYDGFQVIFQPDGYINATVAARCFGKIPRDFLRTEPAKRKIRQIGEKLQIQLDQTVIARSGAPENGGGTWLHPKLAVPFAAWLDDEFAWWCEEQIEAILRGDTVYKEQWRRNLEDRLMFAALPVGFPYFSVFRELLDLTVYLLNAGLAVDRYTLLDISVGQRWSRYWKENGLSEVYGKPTRYPQTFPPSYPQSQANGCIEPWVYPMEAKAEFHQWLATYYIPEHLPTYLDGKIKRQHIDRPKAQKILMVLKDALYIERKAS